MRNGTGQLRDGMAVYSADGHKLGHIVRQDAGSFVIEKGIFFPKDYLGRYEDVADVRDDEVHLAITRDALEQLRAAEVGASRVGAPDAPTAGMAAGTARTEVRADVRREEVDVDRSEERVRRPGDKDNHET